MDGEFQGHMQANGRDPLCELTVEACAGIDVLAGGTLQTCGKLVIAEPPRHANRTIQSRIVHCSIQARIIIVGATWCKVRDTRYEMEGVSARTRFTWPVLGPAQPDEPWQ